MPNYCRHEVEFHCKEPMRQAVLDFLRETIKSYTERCTSADNTDNPYARSVLVERRAIDFNNVIAYPQEFRQRDIDAERLTPEEFAERYTTKGDGYNNGGYEWCIANWGVKWNSINSLYVPQLQRLFFDTAWAPVFEIMSAIHKRFPAITISYEFYERGSGFIGGCEYVSEADWDPTCYSSDDVTGIEAAAKDGIELTIPWEAGKAYNQWTADYLGFKGG